MSRAGGDLATSLQNQSVETQRGRAVMLQAWGAFTVLMSLFAVASTAQADTNALARLSVLSKAMQQIEEQTETRAATQISQTEDSRETQMEGGFCAPGMSCYESAARSDDQFATLQQIVLHVEDRRQPQPRRQGDRLAPIGMIANKTFKGRATAFLVGECHIMTAAHVVIGTPESGRYIDTYPEDKDFFKKVSNVELEFHVGQGSNSPFAEKTKATVEAIGNLDVQVRNLDEDWALLRLDNCLGREDKYGHFELMAATLEDVKDRSHFFKAAGYPIDKDYRAGVWEDPGCTVHDYSVNTSSRDVWATDCNITLGASGGPLYRKAKNGKYYVFGIAVAGTGEAKIVDEFDVADANTFLSLNAFYKKVQPFLEKTTLAKK